MRVDSSPVRAFLALILGSLVATGCSDDPAPALEVQVVTGLVAGPEFGSVLTEVFPGTGTISGTVVPLRVQASFGEPFATGKSVATFPNLAHGDYTVWVHLYRPNGTILIERRVQINYAGAYVLRVHLTRDCLPANITCPDPGGSPEYTECLAGRCVDPRCNPSDPATREFCPDVVFCNADSECTGPVAPCAENKCVSGVCTPTQSSASSCPADSWCDPDSTGVGCTALDGADAGLPDAGAMDGSMLDGAVDMTNPLCGTECAIATVCHRGMWDCTGGVAVCADLGLADEGTACGTGHECTAAGECVASCVPDEPCIIEGSCARATFNCETSACEAIVPAATLGIGDSCGTNQVCNSGGTCVACEAGAECSLGDCELGQVHCESGAPVCGECLGCRSRQAPRGTRCRMDHADCTGDGCDETAICSEVVGYRRRGAVVLNCALPGDACVFNCENGLVEFDGQCTQMPDDFAASGTLCDGDTAMVCNGMGDCVSEF